MHVHIACKQYESDAEQAAGGPVLAGRCGEGGQARKPHSSWASCRVRGPAVGLIPGRREGGGEEERVGQTSEGEVVCSGARGRGRDDASGRPVEPEGKRRKRERQTCRRQRGAGTHPLL